jgi:cadmium resistance transport/sequestration family protein
MSWIISIILTTSIAFAATNLDDLIVLMLFFAQVNASFRKSQIYLGQHLGFAALVLCSLPGFFGGLFIPKAWIGLLGVLPIAFGIRSILNRDNDDDEIQDVNPNAFIQKLSQFIRPETLKVAIVTFANGGDNIGIYVPLFATTNFAQLLVTLGVFFTGVWGWCAIADWLSSHAAIAPLLTRYSHILVPFVLIGLGIYILIENRTWELVI